MTLTKPLISLLETPVPRYTSYPPASHWVSMNENSYKTALSLIDDDSLAFYIHIPFCSSICHYCGCTTYANCDPKVEESYLQTLLAEISLLKNYVSQKTITEIHFGGGTPSKLSPSQLKRILEAFSFPFFSDLELSIEIDPRSIKDMFFYLQELKTLKFTRVSFGVQDLNPSVQKAIGRCQKKEDTFHALFSAKELGFKSIGVDLVYGLPCQTKSTFSETIQELLLFKPHKIALFSFAFMPNLKQNQKKISPELLPSTEEKFSLFFHAKEALLKSGYISIGMDHFVLPEDPLAKAFFQKNISRGFQGYFTKRTSSTIGLGASSISSLKHGYYQNTKDLSTLTKCIKKGVFATERGAILSEDDVLRNKVIESLMCYGRIEKNNFKPSFNIYFKDELLALEKNIPKELYKNTSLEISATEQGFFFLRNIAACFDKGYNFTIQASKG